MVKKKKASVQPYIRPGRAPQHGELVSDSVHVFVDDQNLFYGIQNDRGDRGYRIDFGRLLAAAAKSEDGKDRFVKSAYIAGVIPDDDSFWEAAKSKGFEVRRGYLGMSGGQARSKQDDAYLITEIVSTLYEHEGPSTIVLVAGDADYVPPLLKAQEKQWRVEAAFIDRGFSSSLEPVIHQFRTINPLNIQFHRS